MSMIEKIVLVVILHLVSLTSSLAQSIEGEWATQGYSARIHIAPCSSHPSLLCGTITWLWDPLDERGAPMVDRNNPTHELRQRPLIGLPLLSNFRTQDATHWVDGSIYDPESGHTYKSSLTLKSPDLLNVSGCVLFICRTQTWRRAQSVCPGAN